MLPSNAFRRKNTKIIPRICVNYDKRDWLDKKFSIRKNLYEQQYGMRENCIYKLIQSRNTKTL